jgi:hypothetical protein
MRKDQVAFFDSTQKEREREREDASNIRIMQEGRGRGGVGVRSVHLSLRFCEHGSHAHRNLREEGRKGERKGGREGRRECIYDLI